MKNTASGPRFSGLNLGPVVIAVHHWTNSWTDLHHLQDGVAAAPAVGDGYECEMSSSM